MRAAAGTGSARLPRLRILLAALWYHPERPSGSSRLAYDEARYLATLGHDVWLVAMDGGGGQPEHVVEDGIHVLRYRRPAWAAIDMGAHQRAVRSLLARYVGEFPDVVHAHALLAGAAALDLYGGRARTCYSVHSPVKAELTAGSRGAALHERLRLRAVAMLRSRLEARVLSRCDVVTCFSEFTLGFLASIHGARLAESVRVEPGWVDAGRFRIIEDRAAAKAALGWPLDRPVLFSLRRLVPRMGLDVLMDAAAVVTASGCRFHLIIGGEGPWRGRLEAQAASLGLGGVVRFLGRVPDDRLPMLYGAADASVMPSAELECFGLPVLEAFACGRPVLATPAGALQDVVGSVEPRWLAAAASTEALAVLLRAYLRGSLPARDPFELRRGVVARFDESVRLAGLAAAVTGVGLEV